MPCFTHTSPQTYNDIPCAVDKCAESYLVDNGVDPALAYHVAHLFARWGHEKRPLR